MDGKMSKKDFLKLSMEERRKLLAEQANDPKLIAYYRLSELNQQEVK